jgi:DNA polymerase III alpha subunit
MKFAKITNSSKNGTLKPYFPGWLQERFGDCQAQVSVLTTLKLKNSVKDVARFTLGVVPQDIEDLVKKFEMPPQGLSDLRFIMGWSDDEGNHQGSIERDEALKTYISKYPEQWAIAKSALALPRQRGRHASAFVIAPKPISDFIPITSVSGIKVTAFTGSEIENVGALKFDFLVVLCLRDIQSCLQLIASRKNQLSPVEQNVNGRKVPSHRLVLDPVSHNFVDIWDLPTDLDVYKDVSQGKTETVFQYNTASAVQWLRQFNHIRPDGTPGINSIAAMAAFTALDRPGPLNYVVSNPDVPGQKHNLLVEYARRVRGLPGSKDILPEFDALLPDTYGLIVFQEGLQKVYQNLTGCTGGEAEAFRRLSAKKKPEEMAKLYTFFTERAAPKIGLNKAKEVWSGLLEFSAYSFCQAHSVGYVVISYACAWLKHYYPLEWWCSVLKNAKKEEVTEKFWPYVENIVDLPDIKLSKPTWAIVGDRIRAPIDLCYGIGETAHAQLNQYAPYESADDFCKKIVEYRKAGAVEGKWRRSAITIGTMHTLFVAGILDSLFDPNLSIAERIEQYQTLLKRYTLAEGKKYNKSKVQYPTLDALGRFQVKKDVLPAYSEDIRNLMSVNDGLYFTENETGDLLYHYKAWSREAREEVDSVDRVVSRADLVDVDTALELPQNGFKCAIVGHVDNLETFSYQNKSKSAKKVFIDACGFKKEVVSWPGQDGGYPAEVTNLKVGSIIVGVITKTDLNKGWSFRKLQLIRGPVEKVKDEETK